MFDSRATTTVCTDTVTGQPGDREEQLVEYDKKSIGLELRTLNQSYKIVVYIVSYTRKI